MLIYDVPLFQFAIPVVAVILCVFLVFAFGFKSPGTPPTLDVHDDEEKLQKPKKSGGKKSGKTTDAPAMAKQPFVAPKPLNNIHNNIKVAVVPTSVEKPQNEQPKLKVKKPAPKKVDENANISITSEEAVGDWTTAVSKKNRKNMSKKKEAAVEPLLDLKISKEVVEEVKEQIIEKVEAEKTEAKEVVPSVESVDDAAEEGFTEVVKQKKKQKNKKADKMEENVALLEATIAKECREEHVAVDVADTTPKVIEKAVEASEVVDKAVEAAEVVDEVVATAEVVDEVVEAAEVVDEVMDEGNMEVVKSKKKKKKSETRKNFQEVPLPTSGVEVENEDKHTVQVQPSTAMPSKIKSQKFKKEDGKAGKAVNPPQEVPSNLPEESSAPVVLQEAELATSEQPARPIPAADDQGEWRQARTVKRKRQVQREH